MGSKRPENCPVDSFQWRTGGSPGKGVATIEIAEKTRRLKLRRNLLRGPEPSTFTEHLITLTIRLPAVFIPDAAFSFSKKFSE